MLVKATAILFRQNQQAHLPLLNSSLFLHPFAWRPLHAKKKAPRIFNGALL